MRSISSLEKLVRFARSTCQNRTAGVWGRPHLKTFGVNTDFEQFLESVFDAESENHVFRKFREE